MDRFGSVEAQTAIAFYTVEEPTKMSIVTT